MADDDFYDIKGLGQLQDDKPEHHPEPASRPPRPAGSKHRALHLSIIVLIVILLLGALGLAGYLYQKHHSANTKASTSAAPPPSPHSDTVSANGTKHYVSNGQDLKLEFDYPKDWTVTPSSNHNTNDQTITVSSPSVTMADASGKSMMGKNVVTIRPSSAGLDEFAGTNAATAAQDSGQFAYAKPTADQHQYAYQSFIHFSNGSNTPGAFEEVLVTGAQSFKKGDSITSDIIAGLDPIIAANFYKCDTSACPGKGTGTLSINNNTWQNSDFVQQIQNIFESLQLH